MFWTHSSWPNLMKLHKQIIQDWINPLPKNHIDRTIRTRVIPNLGVHTFIDRQVKQNHLFSQRCLKLEKKLFIENSGSCSIIVTWAHSSLISPAFLTRNWKNYTLLELIRLKLILLKLILSFVKLLESSSFDNRSREKDFSGVQHWVFCIKIRFITLFFCPEKPETLNTLVCGNVWNTHDLP